MRIAHVAPYQELPWSGVLTVVVQLSAALARRGHDVTVWQLHEWDHPAYVPHVARLDSAGVGRVPIRGRRPKGWRGIGRAAAREEAAAGIDVVHLHSVFNPPNTILARGLVGPYALSPHGGYDPVSLRRSRGRKLVYRLAFERAMLARAALLCALTDAEAGQLRAFASVGDPVVIPNGVDRPPSGIDGAAFRRELGLGPADLLALFVGRLDVTHKGLDDLLPALAQASAWHLALVGGDHRGGMATIRRSAVQSGVIDRVHVVGARSGRALHESYAAADLFTLLSRWEGLPMSLLEALAHGVPALVSPAVARLVNVAEAGAGWVATPPRAGQALNDIAELRTETRAARAGAARRLAAAYDWDEAITPRYEAAYVSVT